MLTDTQTKERITQELRNGSIYFTKRGKRKRRQLQPRTQAGYQYNLGRILQWCKDRGTPLHEISLGDWIDWVEGPHEYMSGNTRKVIHWSGNTRKMIQAAVIFWLTVNGHDQAPVLEYVPIVEEDDEIRTVTEHEFNSLLDFLAGSERLSYIRTAAMLHFSYPMGLRVSELCGLTWDRVDLDVPEFIARRKGGRKVTKLPMLPPAREALDAYGAIRPAGCLRCGTDHPEVFLTDEGHPMERNSWRLCLLRMVEALNRANGRPVMPPFGPHALRRGSCVWMVSRGIPPAVIGNVMGWSPKTTDTMVTRYSRDQKSELTRGFLLGTSIGDRETQVLMNVLA